MPNYSYLIAFLNRKTVVLMAERYAWLISDFSEESRMLAEMRVWKCEFGSCFYDS